MKKYILAFVLLLGGMGLYTLQAQRTVSGTVYDKSNGSPMPFATLSVLGIDSTVLTGTVTDVDGHFVISVTQTEASMVVASFVGYGSDVQPLTKEAEIRLVFRLEPESQTLEAVKVTAKAPLIEQQVDKLVVNVSQSAFAQSSNGLELLRKAPGVTIDKDGNVKLNGQAVEVWVDGRPSQLSGQALEAMLRGTDGGSIDKIEVIANPSAKYDAAGQGGIINIKTKRTLAQGFNGTVGGSYSGMFFKRERIGWDYMPGQNVNANLNYRGRNTNTYLQVSESTDKMGVDLFVTTESSMAANLWQQVKTLYGIQISSLNLKVGNDWFIDSKNTLGIIFNMPLNRMYQVADTGVNGSEQTLNGVSSEQAVTYASTEYRNRQYSGNVNYTHVFDASLASELTANFDYFHNVGLSENIQDIYYRIPVDKRYQFTTLNSRNIVDVYSAKADWQRVVWGRCMVEAGAKYALSITNNELEQKVQTPAGTTSGATPFDYNEQVVAGYATIAAQFSPQWTAKIGLRGEGTLAHDNAKTVNQRYFDLFPTAFVGFNPTQQWRLSVSYSRRIQRPNYDQLNPFQNFVDAHTSNIGNPDLKPCYIDNVNLSVGFGRHAMLNITYNHMKDVITKVPLFDVTTGDQLLAWDNFGLNTMLGGSLTLTEVPLAKWLSWMLTLSGYQYNNYETNRTSPFRGYVMGGGNYENHSFYGMGYTSFTFRLPKSWKIELDGWVSTPVVAGYLKTSWSGMANLAVKKGWFDNRLTLSVSMQDILQTFNGDFEVVGTDGVSSRCEQHYYFQKIKVGLVWNFGAAQQPLKHRNVGNLDEAGRVGNSNKLEKQ